MNLGDVSVKEFGNENDFLIKFEKKEDSKNNFIEEIKNDLTKHEQRVAEMNVNLSDGFKITIEIEQSEADQLFMYLAKMTEKAIYQNNQTFLLNRLNRIQKEMQHHHQTVIEAAKRLSNDPEIIRSAVSLSHH